MNVTPNEKRSKRQNKGVPPNRFRAVEYVRMIQNWDQEPRSIEEALQGKNKEDCNK